MKMKSFIKQFTAMVAGDNVEAQAQKTLRSADSALSAQIAGMNGDTIQLEDARDEAAEALVSAIHNDGEVITNRAQYISNLVTAKNRLNIAEENLAEHLDTLKFLEEVKTSIHREVEA